MTLDLDALQRLIRLLDLTNLEKNAEEPAVLALCWRARTPLGPVAAVCVLPRFVSVARIALSSGIRIATVANFPEGRSDARQVVEEIRFALRAGADEVDVVFPYRAWLAGRSAQAKDFVSICKDAVGTERTLKMILETGAFPTAIILADAARTVIAAGADFLKTSTGRRAPGATLEAAQVLMTAIRESGRRVGFKAAGGIHSAAEAAAYLALADDILGADWAAPNTFRIGASKLLDELLAAPVAAGGVSMGTGGRP